MADYGGEYLKKFSPIGCRDEGTLDLLKNFGLTAYLSGCCTLTLKPWTNVAQHGKIVLTDISEPVVKFVETHTKKDIVQVSHHATHWSNFRQLNWLTRRALVEQLLQLYQGASLVVTSRLHAALPCLALGVPVLLVTNMRNDYRFSTFTKYLNNVMPEDLITGNYLFDFDNPKANLGGHENFAVKIEKICSDFVNSCESNKNESRIDVETWLDGQKRNLRLKRIMQTLIPNVKLYRF